MPPLQAQIDDIADRIADGMPIDWPGAFHSDEPGRRVLHNLGIVARVADLYASPSLLTSLTSGTFSAIEGSRPHLPLPAGSMWGHLKILECVGQGRFGVVYRAFDATLEREVALKIVRGRQTTGSEIAHEGRMMARVHHPNVVTVFGAQVIGDAVGIWMQFVRGQTLEAELTASGPFSPDEIIRVGVDLCEALTAVHATGLVHRDVKSANVMRDVNGRIMLGDFGTGQLIDDVRSGMAGTPLYLAPEVMAGAPATPQSDIYSLGVLLFYLATARYPVNGRSIRELRDAHASANRSSLAALRPDLPRELVVAVEGATSADPTARWTSAQTLQGMLEARPTPDPVRSQGFASSLSAVSFKTVAFFVTAAVATLLLVNSATVLRSTIAAAPDGGKPTITTRSTRALRLYTMAATLMQGRLPWPEAEAERLLREALEYDPEFASARILLAHSLNNQRRPVDVVMTEAARALEAANTATESERAFIEGSFYQMRGIAEADDLQKRRRDLEHAARAYERLVTIEPNHVWAYTNLIGVYSHLDRPADILRINLLHAQHNPNSASRQVQIATLYYRIGAFDTAEPFITRALELMRHQVDSDAAGPLVWLQFAPAYRSWFADSAADALRLVEAATLPESDDRVAMVFLRHKVALYLALGRLADAERASDAAPPGPDRDDMQLSVSVYRHDRERMKTLLGERYSTSAAVLRVLFLPIPTDLFANHLRQLLADNPPGLTITAGDRFVAARLALADGRFDEAVATLQAYLPLVRNDGSKTIPMLAALMLSEAWAGKGDASRAIADLESATQLRSAATFGISTGALWMHTRSRLAELYRLKGQVTDANRIEQHLQKLLHVADDQHPLKVRLAR